MGGSRGPSLIKARNFEFKKMAFPDSPTGNAIVISHSVEQATLTKTIDGGQTWVLLSLSRNLRGRSFKNAQEGKIVAAQEVYYTLDGAQSVNHA